MYIENYITKIHDFPAKGILFYDLSPLLASADAWQFTVNKICSIVKILQPDILAGIESRGFLISSAIATKMCLGSLLIRKKGKTPGKVLKYTYKLEYGEDTLELNQDIVKPNQKILIMDDVLATGGTINATVELLKKAQCSVIGALCIIELKKLGGKNKLNIPTYSLLKF